MNRLQVSLLLALTVLVSCHKDDIAADTPTCVRDIINRIGAEPVRNPPGAVWQYTYNGRVVYYIPSHCCDIASELYDDQCNPICSPDGGISGRGDGRCTDFFKSRQAEQLIWKDSRKR